MTDGRTPSDKGLCYAIGLAGHLDDRWSTWLGDLTITREGDGTTTIRGPVADQAELHGLLAKVRDMGATLISLTPVEAHGSQEQQRKRESSGCDDRAETP